MKKIILVGNNIRTHIIFRKDLMLWLNRKNYSVSVACPVSDENDNNIALELGRSGINLHPIRINSKGANPFKDLLLFFQLLALILKVRPNLILNYTIKPIIYGGISAKLTGTISVAIVTGAGYAFLNNNFKAKVARFLYKISLLCANKVVFLNRDDQEMFISRNLVKKNKTILLPGEGFDPNFFKPSKDELTKGTPCRFLFLGRILYDKGIEEYVKMAEALTNQGANAIFEVVGELGAENPSAVSSKTFNRWLSTGAIVYKGYTNEVRPFIESADCVVLPSYREGLSRVLLEAAAMEKPIIASDVPGCREIIKNMETGILVKPRDVGNLVDAAKKIIQYSPAERKSMGEEGRLWVIDNFSNEIVFNKYETLLREIL